MNKKEALDYIKQYQDNLPKPIKYYYHDPYDDGKYCGSGWCYEYPPVYAKLIDAILERDKDCKEYIPDCDCDIDEKFNQEMEKRFTDLMSRAKDTVVEEYRKNNSHLYSMVTENNYNKITVIQMSLSTLCGFKEKCKKAAGEIDLKNFYIYEHKDRQDINGRMIYGSAPYGGNFINGSAEHAFSDMLRYCDYFKKCAKESSNYEIVEGLCDNIKGHIKGLYNVIESQSEHYGMDYKFKQLECANCHGRINYGDDVVVKEYDIYNRYFCCSDCLAEYENSYKLFSDDENYDKLFISGAEV